MKTIRVTAAAAIMAAIAPALPHVSGGEALAQEQCGRASWYALTSMTASGERWNKFAETAREAKLKAREDLDAPPLADLLQLDDAAFRRKFSGSPIKRIGRDRFVRNVLVAAGNSGDAELCAHCDRLLADASPTVRAMAVWAMSRLLDSKALDDKARRHIESETDAEVRAEWTRALEIVKVQE